jgi:hypothetical protein
MNDGPACPPEALFDALARDALPAAEQERLAGHLDGCERCRQALDRLLPEPGAWSALAGACAGGPALDRLRGGLSGGPAFDESPLAFLGPPDGPGCLGRLGAYRVTEVVGRGGMGVVLKAFDPTLQRFVAIKVLAPHLATSAAARVRFLQEARSAAAVRHEHVVAVHAVEEARGLPYLVMEYVAGPSLQERLDRHGPLPTEDVVRVGAQTAAALAAAHAQGVVHRDVKPANILLEDGGAVKITDFGLARAADAGRLTRSGVVAGTPEYMSPEQARGEPTGPRGDLFSLGSVLYALCAGHPPFQADSAVAVLRKVSDAAPRRLREVNPAVPAWLAEIVGRLHAKKPADRFASAAEVADLLGRHLAHWHDPAGAPRPARLSRRPARWEAVAALGALVLLAGLLVVLAAGPGPAGGGGEASEGWREARATLRCQGPVYALAFAPRGAPLLAAGTDEMGVRLWDPAAGQERGILAGHTATVRALSFAPDGGRLASAGDDGLVKVWDLPSRRLRQTLRHGGAVDGVAFAPDGRTLASAGADENVVLWDVPGGAERRRIHAHKGTVYAVAFAPDGGLLATGGADGVVRLWDASSGAGRGAFAAHALAVRALRFSPDGATLASGSWDKTVKLWDVAALGGGRDRPRAVLRGHRHMVLALAFSPDGAVLASASGDWTGGLWDVRAGGLLAWVRGHEAGVRAVAFSPDGRTLATGGGDRAVKLWETQGKGLPRSNR